MSHLVLVPTPIGNLKDMTLRALEVLRNADVIAAEDTRHSRKLLDHYGIETPVLRLDQHTALTRGPEVLENHSLVAFISDAGTPGLSDPGTELIRLALARGDQVEVLPGPTALIPALVLSGLPLARFAFEGFLPRKGKARRERLQEIAARRFTTAIYESPKRLLETLDALIESCGAEREASVSRELSKRFETTLRGNLKEIREYLAGSDVRGEIVLVISPAPEGAEPDFAGEAHRLAAAGLTGHALRQELERLGAPRNVAYALSLEHRKL